MMFHHLILLPSLLIASFLAWSGTGQAQDTVNLQGPDEAIQASGPQPMMPTDFVFMPRLSDPIISPDGRHVIYRRTQTDWDENERINRFILFDRIRGEERPVFEPEEGETMPIPAWAPDGNSFYVVLNREIADPDEDEAATDSETETERLEDDEETTTNTDTSDWQHDDMDQVFRYTLATNTLDRITDFSEDVDDITPAPDGSGFYFTARQPHPEDYDDLLDRDFAITSYEDRRANDLWFFDLETRDSLKIIESEGFYLRGFSLSVSGDTLIYMRSPGPLRDDLQKGDLIVLDLASGTNQAVTHNKYAESGYKLSKGNTHFAYVATVNAAGETYYEDNLFVQRVGDPEPTLILPDAPMEILDFAWGQTANDIFIRANTGLRTQLYHYDVQEKSLTAITAGDHVIQDWQYEPGTGLHAFLQVDANTPGEVKLIQSDGSIQAISKAYTDWPATYRLPRQQAFAWKAADGQALEGLLVYPVGYQEGQRVPLVTITHGGPRSSSQFGSWNMSRSVPVLAGQGYGIFLPNHRGGTGYGDDFVRDMVGGYFTNAHTDVLSGIDALIEAGFADPNQLIKQGWSAGGHMANKLITVTDRFKAVSSGAGVADWISMYGESDIRFNRTPWFGGAVWAEGAPLDTYRAHSPLTQAWNIKTPTLFWNGESDERVPPTQAILMYRAAKAAGAKTRLYLADSQPHGFRKPGFQLFKINTELAWYAEHLGRKAYQADLPTFSEDEDEDEG